MENHKIIKWNVVSVLYSSTWPYLLLHLSTAVLSRSAWAVSSGFTFHLHRLTLIYLYHTEYFPDGKYNYLSQMNFQGKKKKKRSPNSSCIQNSEAGGSVKLSKCKSSFAGLKNSSIFFIASYFCQENGVKKHASVNTAFVRIPTVLIFESVYVILLF